MIAAPVRRATRGAREAGDSRARVVIEVRLVIEKLARRRRERWREPGSNRT